MRCSLIGGLSIDILPISALMSKFPKTALDSRMSPFDSGAPSFDFMVAIAPTLKLKNDTPPEFIKYTRKSKALYEIPVGDHAFMRHYIGCIAYFGGAKKLKGDVNRLRDLLDFYCNETGQYPQAMLQIGKREYILCQYKDIRVAVDYQSRKHIAVIIDEKRCQIISFKKTKVFS